MDPFEVPPPGNDPAGAGSAGNRNTRFLFWDGERLVPCSVEELEHLHASGQVGDLHPTGPDAHPRGLIPDGDELVQEYARDGGAQIEYWVPDGEELVPATPEQVERFREYDRELVARSRLQLWHQAEQRRARWRRPRQVYNAVREKLAGGADRARGFAGGSRRLARRLSDRAFHRLRPDGRATADRQHSQP
jgi:hypothetical protein